MQYVASVTLAKTKDEKTIVEIVRLGEVFLAEQLKAGLASDLRAMTLAVILAAVVAGLVGATATILASTINTGPHIIAIFTLCGCLLVAMCMAVQAARPTEFSYGGNNPKRWSPVVGEKENRIRALAVQASFYSQGIEANNDALRANNRYVNKALWWVLIGVLAAVGVETSVILTLIARVGLAAVF